LEEDLRPKLSELLLKALSLSSNLVLLLPTNIDEQQLAEIFSKALQKSAKKSSCCIELEKIYFVNTLKYMVVYYGPLVNHRTKL